MTWARLDDGLTFHDKIVGAGNAATGVWTRALAWSAFHLTDGHVPTHIARLIAGESRRASKDLIRVGLWLECPGGYQIHDYLEYNPSRAEVLAKREKERKRKSGNSGALPRGRDAPSAHPDPDPDPIPYDHGSAVSDGNGRTPIETVADMQSHFAKRCGIGIPPPVVARLMDLAPISEDEADSIHGSRVRTWDGLERYVLGLRNPRPERQRGYETPEERRHRENQEYMDSLGKETNDE